MAEDLLKRLDISREGCDGIVRQMIDDMDRDMQQNSCCFRMLNTYVRKLPSGDEKGRYMAIDIGGTNLRVQMFECDRSCVMVENQKFVMSEEIKNSNKNKLFGYIADCTKECLLSIAEKEGVKVDSATSFKDIYPSPIPLGFTFSYPVKQTGIKSGVLLRWTKEMNVEGVVGNDVVAMLEEALRQRELPLRVEAMVNDTVGTLVSSSFEDHDTYVAIINGTGSNICYMDFKQQVVINMEFGSYGTGRRKCFDVYSTEIDRLIDEQSLNPGEQIIEKTISGKYMGEVLRQLLVKMESYNKILKGRFEEGKECSSAKNMKERDVVESKKGGEGDGKRVALFRQYALTTDMMAKIESDPSTSTKLTAEVMGELGLAGVGEEDLMEVQKLCRVISGRAAKLLAAGVSAAILKVDRPKVTVAYDGSVIKNYPLFKQRLLDEINQNLQHKIQIKLMLSEDGSGRGAALVAASNPSEGV